MDALKTLRVCLDANIPCILWGADGEGKTKGVGHEVSVVRGWHFFPALGNNMDPTDFGIPVVNGEEVKRVPLSLAIREAKRLGDAGEHVVIFLDEMNTSAPAVQATMLTLMSEWRAGDTQLSREFVHFACAANPPEIAVNASDFQPPTCTRMVHIDWKLDFDVWKNGMASGDWAPLAQAVIVVAFLDRRRGAFRQDPSREFMNKPRATPRTWTNLACLLDSAVKAGAPRDVIHMLACGTVGDGMGTEFMGFWEMRERIPTPEAVLASADTYMFPDRGDLCYLMFSSVGAHVTENPTVENWQKVWTLIGRTKDTEHFDKAALCAQVIARLLSQDSGKHLRKCMPKEVSIFAGMFRELGVLGGGK